MRARCDGEKSQDDKRPKAPMHQQSTRADSKRPSGYRPCSSFSVSPTSSKMTLHVPESNEANQVVLPVNNSHRTFYLPNVGEILGQGSTSLVAKIKPGTVIKSPRYSWWDCGVAELHHFVTDVKYSFEVEEQLLNKLGTHPRIVRYIINPGPLIQHTMLNILSSYLGPSIDPRGLLFEEASDGNLKAYIDQHNDSIDLHLRLKWCRQAAEAIHYIHQKGVMHSDLRPENFLLHSKSDSKLDLLLCDFGGSMCGDIDGVCKPDSGFFDPCKPLVSTEAVDIFNLGSIFYLVMTGRWPCKIPRSFETSDENMEYGQLVNGLSASQKYPDHDGHSLPGGAVIQRCWTGRYSNLEELIRDQNLLFSEIEHGDIQGTMDKKRQGTN
ncbi:hypothetical protein N7456_012440 [Penicillium angulare]|uniref:EKC/KEOPS complex subunit BUD32 n=1 Tax=Penicillium angulare TaxID=116970 RepID=A0A9W9EVS9_9EURO|nr:hypothetical protein N7456_012440 [Penicillium angulare]